MTEKTEKAEKPTFELAKMEDFLPQEVAWEDIKENLADSELSCPKIKFSSSEANFSLSGADDDEGETVKSFTGIIFWWSKQNTYWSSGFDPANPGPPDCFSIDGKTGSKFGNCATCKFNQFGSAAQGKGKACRNQIKLYIQLENKAIPMTLLLSPKNLSAFNKGFLTDVTQKGLAYWKIKAKFTAYKNKAKGETFARIKIEILGVFKGEELEKLTEIRTFWLSPIQQEHFANSGQSAGADDDSAPSSRGSEIGSDDSETVMITPKKNKLVEAVIEEEDQETSVEVVAKTPPKKVEAVLETKTETKTTPKKKKEEIVYEDDNSDEPPF